MGCGLMSARIINLYAGPGSGKSTTAAGLFYLMKAAGMKVELTTEYAKDLEYMGQLDNSRETQWKIFFEQSARIRAVSEKVDWIITDAPIFIQGVYARRNPNMRSTNSALLEVLAEQDSRNEKVEFFIERVKPFQRYGRSQNESEARDIDVSIRNMLNHFGRPFTSIQGDWTAPIRILELLNIWYGVLK